METDHLLVLGAGIFALGVPSLAAAWADERRPVVAGVVFAVGLLLVAIAWAGKPGGYRPAELPQVFLGVVGDVLH